MDGSRAKVAKPYGRFPTSRNPFLRVRGTPSLIVIDRVGRIRVNAFGQADDMAVGAVLARLIDEPRPEPESD